MFARFTDRANRVAVLGQAEARAMCHEQAGTGHLLVALVAEGEGVAYQALSALSVTEAALRRAVLAIAPAGEPAPAGPVPWTPRAKKVLELSLRESLELGCSYIGTEHLLLGLIRVGDGAGVDVLAGLGTEAEAVRAKVLELLRGYEEPAAPPRVYQATIHETTLGSIRLGHGKTGPEVVITGPQGCVHRITAAEAREAAVALVAVAGDPGREAER